MKKSIVILCTVLLAACGTSKNQVRLTSTVEDGTITSVTYAPLTADFSPANITTPAEERGNGSYALPDDGPVYILSVIFNDREDQLRTVVLMPGEQVTLSGNLNIETGNPNVVISGTELYDAFYKNLRENEAQTKRASLLMRKASVEELAAAEKSEYDSLMHWSANFVVDQVREHPESPVTAYYMLVGMIPDSCFTQLYNALPEEVLNGKYKPLYDFVRPSVQDTETVE